MPGPGDSATQERGEPPPPKGFISYSHESDDHNGRVYSFAQALRADGIDVQLDRFQSRPRGGWVSWTARQLDPDASEHVLLVGTPDYWDRLLNKNPEDETKGVFWEGRAIYGHLFNDKQDERFTVVYFEKGDERHIPAECRWLPHYHVTDFKYDGGTGYEDLYRLLTNQPATPPGNLGPRKKLETKWKKAQQPAEESSLHRRASVEKLEALWTSVEEVAEAPSPSLASAAMSAPEEVAAPATIPPATRAERQATGTVLVADVADFSEARFDNTKRVRIFEQLWDFVLRKTSLGGFSGEVYCDNMLDGAVVTFGRGVYHEAIQLAKEWIKFAETILEGEHVLLRVGIDQGDYHLVRRTEASTSTCPSGGGDTGNGTSSTTRPDADWIPIGKVINDADRLARIAGSDRRGFVVLSERFLKQYHDHNSKRFDEELAPVLNPPMKKSPLQKQAKMGHPQEFRVLNIHETKPQEPTGVRELRMLDSRIHRVMKTMANDFWHAACFDLELGEFNDSLMKRVRRKGKLRISLFCPDPKEERRLICTTFRLLDWDFTSEEAKLREPSTEYPLDTDGVHGPAGAAFKEAKIISLHKLPEVPRVRKTGELDAASLKSYMTALEKKGCGVHHDMAKAMNRHARTYLCIPMAGVDDEKPTVVACLDLVDPMEWLSLNDLREIGELLQEDFAISLSLLIERRT